MSEWIIKHFRKVYIIFISKIINTKSLYGLYYIPGKILSRTVMKFIQLFKLIQRISGFQKKEKSEKKDDFVTGEVPMFNPFFFFFFNFIKKEFLKS